MKEIKDIELVEFEDRRWRDDSRSFLYLIWREFWKYVWNAIYAIIFLLPIVFFLGSDFEAFELAMMFLLAYMIVVRFGIGTSTQIVEHHILNITDGLQTLNSNITIMYEEMKELQEDLQERRDRDLADIENRLDRIRGNLHQITDALYSISHKLNKPNE